MFCIRARSSQAAENSDDVKARVELAFQPTSKVFVFDPNPAQQFRPVKIVCPDTNETELLS
jgi:hypothetical protein